VADLTLSVKSLDGRYSFSQKVPSEKGIHKFLWDRKFDGEDLTIADRDELVSKMESLMETYSSGTLRRILGAVQKTTDSDEIRSLVDPIVNGGYGINLGSKFTTGRAGPGTYLVEIKSGTSSSKTSITIREDPLLKD
jgi:hypothetical protein